MRARRAWLALATAAALAAVLSCGAQRADAMFTCGCFANEADASILAIMCTSYYMPRSILGWGAPRNAWQVIDCKYCGTFNCTPSAEPRTVVDRPAALTPHRAPPAPPHRAGGSVDAPVRRLPRGALAVGAVETLALAPGAARAAAAPRRSGDGDPVPCCCYAKAEYSYAEGIHCDAINPESGNDCEGQEYGADLIGRWLVSDMWNQCYFITGTEQRGASSERPQRLE